MIDYIRKVSAGIGGEALLIIGSEKTAVYDTGMAYCGSGLVENVKKELKGGSPDYVLLSHTHYDHLGGMPYLRHEWPGIRVFGAAHGKDILQRPGALKAIRSLAKNAAKEYTGIDELDPDYSDKDLRIDAVVGNGDKISLGNKTISVYETKGHTNCSLTFFIEEDSVIFAGESTGVYVGNGEVIPSILTGYFDVINSIETCRSLNAKCIFSPHSLLVDGETAGIYWDLCKSAADEFKDITLNLYDDELSNDEIVEAQRERWWVRYCRDEQPSTAFEINTRAGINAILKEFRHSSG